MFFLLSAPEYNKFQSNTTKIKVYLRNGIAEIFDQHQDLMGRVENNLIEVETILENKLEKRVYVLQDAVFIVSTKGLEKEGEIKGTGVYVYARRVREVNKNTSLDEITKTYEQKSLQLEKEIQKYESIPDEKKKKDIIILNSKTLLLRDEVEFLKRAIIIIKNFKA
jgi:hypothetical protein